MSATAPIQLYTKDMNGFQPWQLVDALSPQHLQLTVLPTEKCNFRCTYCYEDFELGKMSEATQRGIEKLMERRVPRLKKLSLSFFGGEPLLEENIVLRLWTTARRLCKEHSVFLEGGITTNGYRLTKDIATVLAQDGYFHFQISLDGWGEVHDETRRRADGRGTFDVIWRNLIMLKELPHPFKVFMRIHFRKTNLENLKVLMREIATTFKGDPRFELHFQHLRNLTRTETKVADPFTKSELLALEPEFMKIWRDALPSGCSTAAEPPPVKESNDTHNAKPEPGKRAAYLCYAAKPNFLMVRSNGRLGKCTVAFDDPRNDLGFIDENGMLLVDNEKAKLWSSGLETFDLNACACPLTKLPGSVKASPETKVAYFDPAKIRKIEPLRGEKRNESQLIVEPDGH